MAPFDLKFLILLLRLSSCAAFLGRSWEHFAAASSFQRLFQAEGAFLLLCALLSLTVKKNSPFQSFILRFGSALLMLYAFLSFQRSGFQFPQFLEYACQFASPLLLLEILRLGAIHKSFLLFLKTAIAATFLGHGIYALNLFPTPGSWEAMTMTILGISQEGSRMLLRTAGTFDLICVFWIFLPKYLFPPLLYTVAWGYLTALARVVAHFNPTAFPFGLDPWLFETIVRLPHGLLPTVLLGLYFSDGLPLPCKEATERLEPQSRNHN